jgi:hypothetical protein
MMGVVVLEADKFERELLVGRRTLTKGKLAGENAGSFQDFRQDTRKNEQGNAKKDA